MDSRDEAAATDLCKFPLRVVLEEGLAGHDGRTETHTTPGEHSWHVSHGVRYACNGTLDETGPQEGSGAVESSAVAGFACLYGMRVAL